MNHYHEYINPVLPFAFMAALPMTSCNAVQEQPDLTRPNIIYLLADDMGIGDLGCYGQQMIKTPTIDSLANASLKFSHHYSGSTVSAPSRCCLLTGKHTGHAYIRGNMGDPDKSQGSFDYPIGPDEVTVAQILQQKGYKTGCVGKWGLGGPSSIGSPDKKGFDYFFGYLGQGNAHRYYPDCLWENNRKVELNNAVYSHDLIVEKGLDFIKRNTDENFFLYMAITLPHADLLLPDKYIDEYAGKFEETPFDGTHFYHQQQPKAAYAAMVTRIDSTLKQVLDLLEEQGLTENTIVIFSSDNGVHCVGGHDPEFFQSNGEFRGYKRDLYEGGVRTPLIISWPAVIKSHRETALVSAFWDFLPTVCDIVGAEVPEGVDGLSILPEISGKGKQAQHDCLYWEFYERGGKQAVLQGDWKLIGLEVGSKNPVWELYNIKEDPSETTDLYAQYPEKAAELKLLMKENHQPSELFSFSKKKNSKNKNSNNKK